jgi:hypothetical protein
MFLSLLQLSRGRLQRPDPQVDGAAQIRDEESRQAGEQQLGAFVKAS